MENQLKPQPNKQNDLCAFCFEVEGTEPISDSDNTQYWVCEKCESKIEWE